MKVHNNWGRAVGINSAFVFCSL